MAWAVCYLTDQAFSREVFQNIIHSYVPRTTKKFKSENSLNGLKWGNIPPKLKKVSCQKRKHKWVVHVQVYCDMIKIVGILLWLWEQEPCFGTPFLEHLNCFQFSLSNQTIVITSEQFTSFFLHKRLSNGLWLHDHLHHHHFFSNLLC